MTVVVGYLLGKGGDAPLRLGAETARELGTSLTVVTVVPRPWMTPSPARVDAEFAVYAQQLGADSHREAAAQLAGFGADLEVRYRTVPSRTAGDGLLEAVAAEEAQVLVVGSSSDGALGQVVLGSTTDWLVHASPVPVALCPRGYRGSRSGGLSRITWACSGSPGAAGTARQVQELSVRLSVPLRVVSFAVRGRTMFPPETGLHAEDSLLAEWSAQLREGLARLKADGLVGPETVLQVVLGNSWDQALATTEWEDGEILVLGTTSRRNIKGVFLGSHGAKIIRHSPVPVLVLPA